MSLFYLYNFLPPHQEKHAKPYAQHGHGGGNGVALVEVLVEGCDLT